MEEDQEENFSLELTKKKKKKKSTKDEASTSSSSESKQEVNDEEKDYTYLEMLQNLYARLQQDNPSGNSRHRKVLPPVSVARAGTKKTIWCNFYIICQGISRNFEHVKEYFETELGTDSSVDGSKNLIIKGKYLSTQIETILKKYINEYVTCLVCRSGDTTLTKDSVTRLLFLECDKCKSKRSVSIIRSGLRAITKADRRKARMDNE